MDNGNLFQSLSGLTLGLNFRLSLYYPLALRVSIPFRADTGFELTQQGTGRSVVTGVSIPFRADTGFELPHVQFRLPEPPKFQSLSGLTLGLNDHRCRGILKLRQKFQSLSGLTLGLNPKTGRPWEAKDFEFQSLSGLTLGLNATSMLLNLRVGLCFNPFQG